jgi:hypothetical protein
LIGSPLIGLPPLIGSMIKRRQGAHVHARTYHNQCRELRLMALTHNIMILLWMRVFYRAVLTPFFAFSRK